MESIKSPRFWLAIAGLLAVTVLAALHIFSDKVAAGLLGGILYGLGVSTGRGNASGNGTLGLVAAAGIGGALLLGGCDLGAGAAPACAIAGALLVALVLALWNAARAGGWPGAVLALVLIAPAAGCSSWSSDLARGLSITQEAGQIAYEKIRPRYQQRCLSAARACEQRLESCQAYVACDSERHRVLSALRSLQQGVAAAADVLPQIKEVLR